MPISCKVYPYYRNTGLPGYKFPSCWSFRCFPGVHMQGFRYALEIPELRGEASQRAIMHPAKPRLHLGDDCRQHVLCCLLLVAIGLASWLASVL